MTELSASEAQKIEGGNVESAVLAACYLGVGAAVTAGTAGVGWSLGVGAALASCGAGVAAVS